MNEFGYLLYEDYPLNASATVTTPLQKQAYAQNIVSLENLTDHYYDYATFEAGHFDFKRPIFTTDPEEKLAFTSQALSDVQGALYNATITITPSGTYSGAGFSLRTYNKWYNILVTVTDEDGTRYESFTKTSDEFYPCQFNGLQSLEIRFRTIIPNTFLKIVGYQLGVLRELKGDDLMEVSIVNNFSLTNEEFEFDTLDFVMAGDKEHFNIQQGERLTNTRTGQKFYVSGAEYNNDGTISVSCYDNSFLLENSLYKGIMPAVHNAETLIETLLSGGGDIDVTVDDMFIENQTAEGTVEVQSYREAARMALQGNCVTAQRINNGYRVFCPLNNKNVTAVFDEDIILLTPTIERLDKYKLIHFMKYYYKLNKLDGKKEAYNGLIDCEVISGVYLTSTIFFDEPFAQVQYYYVSGQDEDDNDILQPVDPTMFFVSNQGSYFATVINKYTQRIVAMGYPYNESSYSIDIKNPAPTAKFSTEEIDITDCTKSVDLDYYYGDFADLWKYVYGFTKRIEFSSIVEVNAGDYVELNFDGNTYVGWIIRKTESLSGLFEYEVMCE